MRWKLLFVAPLLAAAVSTGAVALWLSQYKSHAGSPLDLVFMFGPPLLAAAVAGFFVYRHTPRRRVLQAAISVLLSLVLFYAGFAAADRYFFR
ncbi:MAG TPA: hypothetical protein VGX48_01490 [Pyrinomonadaceae bacterium]|jgi:hypothetical protein|nr:hypothetical protein [Pyrinomonadaceae bacterium]